MDDGGAEGEQEEWGDEDPFVKSGAGDRRLGRHGRSCKWAGYCVARGEWARVEVGAFQSGRGSGNLRDRS